MRSKCILIWSIHRRLRNPFVLCLTTNSVGNYFQFVELVRPSRCCQLHATLVGGSSFCFCFRCRRFVLGFTSLLLVFCCHHFDFFFGRHDFQSTIIQMAQISGPKYEDNVLDQHAVVDRIVVKIPRVDNRPERPVPEERVGKHFQGTIGGLFHEGDHYRRSVGGFLGRFCCCCRRFCFCRFLDFLTVFLLLGHLRLEFRSKVRHAIISVDIQRRAHQLVRDDLAQGIHKLVLSIGSHRHSLVDDDLQKSPPVVQPTCRYHSKSGTAQCPRSVPFRLRIHDFLGGRVAKGEDDCGSTALDKEGSSDEGLGVFIPCPSKEAGRRRRRRGSGRG
mmetsp:Transcript_22340/g.55361  ORF Transcript_22340/g.55361 Transcript_22340/m.55361 type:complete len:331 (+) Transcript_22340:327-1319(+)